jgi:hypothetical protein
MSRRRSRRHPMAVAAAATLALITLDLAWWMAWLVWHTLPVLLAAAAVIAACHVGNRRGRTSLPPGPGPGRAEDAETIPLRAEVEALTAERDEAPESARAAWEASSEPRGSKVVDLRARLIGDPRSGARPLGGT